MCVLLQNSRIMDNAQSSRHDHDVWLIKLILWFIGLCIVGFVVCVILGMLRVAVQAIVIVAAVLMFFILIGIIIRERIRDRIRRNERGESQ